MRIKMTIATSLKSTESLRKKEERLNEEWMEGSLLKLRLTYQMMKK
jgi:hypothetical protein